MKHRVRVCPTVRVLVLVLVRRIPFARGGNGKEEKDPRNRQDAFEFFGWGPLIMATSCTAVRELMPRKDERSARGKALIYSGHEVMYGPLLARCRCLSFGRLSQRQEITSRLINDSPLLCKGPTLHDPSAGSA